jgi:uncharacterized membrane protein
MVDPAFALLAVLLLAVVFGAAALAKLRDLDSFQGVVEQYRLLPAVLVEPFVRVLPVVELGAALGLLLPATRALAAATLVGLLVLFAAAMAINLARGRSDIDCGCFIGVQKQRISWTLVVRNLMLAGFGLMLLVEGTGRPLAALDWVTITAAAASLLLLYEAVGRLFGLAPRPLRGTG